MKDDVEKLILSCLMGFDYKWIDRWTEKRTLVIVELLLQLKNTVIQVIYKLQPLG